MIEIKEYTKEDMAFELGLHDNKASHITDKLKRLGYQFVTSGKGRTYRIYITRLPQTSLKEFAEQHLGICARFEDRLAHFLQLLLTSGNRQQFANMSASSLEWHTPSNNDTIQKWLDSLIDCGLLVEETLIDVFYATMKETTEYPDDNGDYKYTQIYKEITREEYNAALKAYNDRYNSLMPTIDKNPDCARDEAIYLANMERKAALNGWWAMKKRYNFKTFINEEWAHYNELISLLDDFQFEICVKEKTGNVVKESDEWEKRVSEWENEKAEKRKKLQKEKENEKIPVVEAEEPKAEELATVGQCSHYKELQEALVDLPRVDNFRDYLFYIQENIIKTKMEVAKYYV